MWLTNNQNRVINVSFTNSGVFEFLAYLKKNGITSQAKLKASKNKWNLIITSWDDYNPDVSGNFLSAFPPDQLWKLAKKLFLIMEKSKLEDFKIVSDTFAFYLQYCLKEEDYLKCEQLYAQGKWSDEMLLHWHRIVKLDHLKYYHLLAMLPEKPFEPINTVLDYLKEEELDTIVSKMTQSLETLPRKANVDILVPIVENLCIRNEVLKVREQLIKPESSPIEYLKYHEVSTGLSYYYTNMLSNIIIFDYNLFLVHYKPFLEKNGLIGSYEIPLRRILRNNMNMNIADILSDGYSFYFYFYSSKVNEIRRGYFKGTISKEEASQSIINCLATGNYRGSAKLTCTENKRFPLFE